MLESVVSMFEIVKNIGGWVGYLNGLEGNMQNLKRKIDDLSYQKSDIEAEITSSEDRPRKRLKKQVEAWLRDVSRLKNNVQRLDQEVEEGSVFSRLRLGNHISTKIQEATELQEKGKAFDGLQVDEPIGRLLMPPTEAFVETTEARNVERVWECLMNDKDRQVGVWGMGGVGKTTIMKHIHNKLLEETDKFVSVFWVTVSKAFNVRELQREIAKELKVEISDDEDVTRRAAELFALLSRRERYVLILDDLWEEFPLGTVGIPEPTRSNGCKLVLTTRSLEVCRRMGCTPVQVELLTEEEALMLFLRKAVGSDTVLAPIMEEIATQIAKECARLPLAIAIVGGSLRGLKGIREWRNALNELISSTKEVNDGERKVFERLKFSYSRLGDEVLQNCFLYCSLYPEDHEIPVEELIEYWIAEGLIGEMNKVEDQFDKAHAILGKLTSTCLLENSFDRDAGVESLRMHDLIRDMALRIATNRPRFMVKAGEHLESIPDEVWYEDLDRASFMHCYISELPIRPPVCPRLTTLLFRGMSRFVYMMFPNDFFINMPCLTVLDLSGCYIEKLPQSISNLENLHALLLEDCPVLEDVPSLKKLKALKVFKLTRSKIEELPDGIEELINLRKLDLSNNRGLRPFRSRKLRRLSKLQYLRTDGTKIQVSVEDLLCLKQLKVVAVQFHNVQELTRYVRSQQFQGMEKYHLVMGKDCSSIPFVGKGVCISPESVPFGSVVDHLVFPADINYFKLYGVHDLVSLSAIPWWNGARDLRGCSVSQCNGLECIFSEDGQISLGTVESLNLFNLPRFRVLFDRIAPPHNIYSNLKNLYFWDCPTVKNIFPVQFLQNFPNLESLTAERCNNLEDIISETAELSDWGNLEDDSNSISLPKLKVLHLFDLPSLKSIYNGMMVCHSIEDVRVRECPLVRRLPLSLHMDSEQATAPPSLRGIQAEDEWWESLDWDDPRAKQILQPFQRNPVLNWPEDW